MSLTLVRYRYTNELVQGFILKDGLFFCDTLECPWLNNKRNISCIPEGTYKINYRHDPHARVKTGYMVDDVPGRNGIMIHVANEVSQIEGCIAVGVRHGDAVYRSAITFEAFREAVGNQAELKITGVPNEL